jgi:hypothetical protein
MAANPIVFNGAFEPFRIAAFVSWRDHRMYSATYVSVPKRNQLHRTLRNDP